MPTHDEAIQFFNEYKRLSAHQKALFRRAQAQMVSDLKARRPFSMNLRIHRVKKAKDVWEMTWDADGRATFITARRGNLEMFISTGGASAIIASSTSHDA